MLNKISESIKTEKDIAVDNVIGVMPCGITIMEKNSSKEIALKAENALYRFCNVAETNINIFSVIDWDWELTLESKFESMTLTEMTTYLDALTQKITSTARIFKTFGILGMSPNFYWMDMELDELESLNLDAFKFMWYELG